MKLTDTVLITGAAGCIGGKLRRHLEGRAALRLLDIDPRGDAQIVQADLSTWDARWVRQFDDVHTVIHLAGDPSACRSWEELIAPNIDGLINVFTASALAGVKRVIFASSNHVMGGYQKSPEVDRITTDFPPRPGTECMMNGRTDNSIAYGAAKLFGERLGKCYAATYGMSVVAVRIGWVWRHADNIPENLPSEPGDWFRLIWLSDRDLCHLFDCCLAADPSIPFLVVNGMSANTGSRWDLDQSRRTIGYEPQDDITRTLRAGACGRRR